MTDFLVQQLFTRWWSPLQAEITKLFPLIDVVFWWRPSGSVRVHRPPKLPYPWLEDKETGQSPEFGTVISQQSLWDPIKAPRPIGNQASVWSANFSWSTCNMGGPLQLLWQVALPETYQHKLSPKQEMQSFFKIRLTIKTQKISEKNNFAYFNYSRAKLKCKCAC